MRMGGFFDESPPKPNVDRGPLKETKIPLTKVQKELWFLSRLGDEESVAYTETLVFRMKGSFNLMGMRRALQKVVDRHDALRTISIDEDYQQILPHMQIEVPLIDLSVRDERKRRESIEQWLREESRRPMDLKQGPLIRAHILREDEKTHFLVLVLHHIITDGWSISVLVDEMEEIYNA